MSLKCEAREVLHALNSHSISAAQTVPVYLPVRYLTLTRSFSRSSPISLDRPGLGVSGHHPVFELSRATVRLLTRADRGSCRAPLVSSRIHQQRSHRPRLDEPSPSKWSRIEPPVFVQS